MHIYTVEQMRRLESLADAAGTSYASMMESAGQAVAQQVIALGENMNAAQQKVLVVAGPGNNGGDGLVAARCLAQAGNKVVVITVGRHNPDALREAARASGVTLTTKYDQLPSILSQVDVVIDALFGTGLSRPISGDAAILLEQLAVARENDRRGFYLIGVDGPSGLNGDTGAVDPLTVPVNQTVTFGGVKIGMIAPNAVDFVGRITVADIGIPADTTARVEPVAGWLDVASVAPMLPKRPRSGHKGTFGTVMVIGGSINYVGAPALSALAAGRSGAGVVTLAVPLVIHPMLAARADLTTATWLPLSHDFGAVRKESADTVHKALERVTALVVGPGLGGEETTRQFVYALLNITESARPKGSVGFVGWRDATPPTEITLPPTVVDADALNALAAYPGEWWHNVSTRMVLTPHPRELARLLKCDTGEIQRDRLKSALGAAERFNQVVVLKGAHTVVAAPDGRLAVNSAATSALAKAGSGDVLAGVIGALLAQGVAPWEAACIAVVVHGRAGVKTGAGSRARGIIASDLIDRIKNGWHEFEP